MPPEWHCESATKKSLSYHQNGSLDPFTTHFQEPAYQKEESPVVGLAARAVDYAYLGEGLEDLGGALVAPVVSLGHLFVY